jgi:uncharacterized RDD family membrane protein YckC
VGRALRSAPGYQPADGTYRATTAPLSRRVAASAIDWSLAFVCFLLVSIPLGVLETLGDAVGGAPGFVLALLANGLALGIVVAYFGYFLSTGHTMGMRAFDIHVFAYGSGREPHPVRAVARALLSILFFLATLKAYSLIRGFHGPEGLSATDQNWRDAAVTIACVAFLGGIWKIVDPEGRSLWDRLTGLVVVEDVVPANMPERLWSRWNP